MTFTLAVESGVEIETSRPSGDTRMWLWEAAGPEANKPGFSRIRWSNIGGKSILLVPKPKGGPINWVRIRPPLPSTMPSFLWCTSAPNQSSRHMPKR